MTQLSSFDRRRTASPRAYEPKTLNARHHEILRLSLLGYSNKEIAGRLDCTPATVSNVLNSGLGREHSALLRAEADYNALETAKRIREISPKAIELVERLITDDDTPAAVRLRAAQDVLDRAGFAPVKNVNVKSTSVTLTGADLDALKETALQRARMNGLVVDVESSPCISSHTVEEPAHAE